MESNWPTSVEGEFLLQVVVVGGAWCCWCLLLLLLLLVLVFKNANKPFLQLFYSHINSLKHN